MPKKCKWCNGTGIFSRYSFCKCDKGVKLLEDISTGKKECPSCSNQGLFTITDSGYTCSVTYHYCECSYADSLKEGTKKDPTSCPVCHGTRKYDPIDDKQSYGDNTGPCICTEISK